MRLEWKSKFEFPKKRRQPKFSDIFQAIKLEKLESINEYKGLDRTYNQFKLSYNLEMSMFI